MKDYKGYYQTNMNAKILHDGSHLLDRALDGFESYEAFINDNETPTRVLMYQKWDANHQTKKVLGKREDIELGNLLVIEDNTWLITTFPEDNKFYRKAEMQVCNATFPIKYNKTRVLIGHDYAGRPVYEDQIEEIRVPCVVESQYTRRINNSIQFNIPEGRMRIMLPYQITENTTVNFEFEMHEQRYKIFDIDFSDVINEKGIMTIIAEKVV